MISLVYHCFRNFYSVFPLHRRLSSLVCLVVLLYCHTGWANGVVLQDKQTEGLAIQSLHVVTVHDGTQQTLTISPTITYNTQTQRIALVVPVPAAPQHFGTLDHGMTRDAHRFIRLVRHQNPISIKDKSPSDKRVLTKQQKAQPVSLPFADALRAKVHMARAPGFGQPAVDWLAKWYQKQGLDSLFKAIDKDTLEYYRQRKWTFVVVTYTIKKPQQFKRARLKPLTISFKTPRVILPLKWPWSTSPFALRADIVRTKPLPATAFAQPASMGWEIASSFGFTYDGPLKQTPLGINLSTFKSEQAPGKLKRVFRPWIKPDTKLYVRTIYASSIEGKRHPKTWIEDFALPYPEGQQLMANTAELPKKTPTQSGRKTLSKTAVKAPNQKTMPPKAAPKPKKQTTSGCQSVNGVPTSLVLWGFIWVGFLGLRRRR